MDLKTKVAEWNTLQVQAKDAHEAGNAREAQQRLEAASIIEAELRQSGHDIRQLVCP